MIEHPHCKGGRGQQRTHHHTENRDQPSPSGRAFSSPRHQISPPFYFGTREKLPGFARQNLPTDRALSRELMQGSDFRSRSRCRRANRSGYPHLDEYNRSAARQKSGADDIAVSIPYAAHTPETARNTVLHVGNSIRAQMGNFWRAPRAFLRRSQRQFTASPDSRPAASMTAISPTARRNEKRHGNVNYGVGFGGCPPGRPPEKGSAATVRLYSRPLPPQGTPCFNKLTSVIATTNARRGLYRNRPRQLPTEGCSPAPAQGRGHT